MPPDRLLHGLVDQPHPPLAEHVDHAVAPRHGGPEHSVRPPTPIHLGIDQHPPVLLRTGVAGPRAGPTLATAPTDEDRFVAQRDATSARGWIQKLPPAERPFTSGVYISSARAPGMAKRPAVVARAT